MEEKVTGSSSRNDGKHYVQKIWKKKSLLPGTTNNSKCLRKLHIWEWGDCGASLRYKGKLGKELVHLKGIRNVNFILTIKES